MITGKHCASFQEMAQRVASDKISMLRMRFGMARAATMLTGDDGRKYIFATSSFPRVRVLHSEPVVSPSSWEWGVALLVSGRSVTSSPAIINPLSCA